MFLFLILNKFKVYDNVEILKKKIEYIMSKVLFIEFEFFLNIINDDKMKKEKRK